MPKCRKEPNTRRDVAHRLLFYISQETSAKHPEWRDATIEFLWNLYELRDRNPAILISVHKVDGVMVRYDATPIAYFHFHQRHMLVHAAPGYILWSKEAGPFSTRHKGSWPLMWRCEDSRELRAFLRIVRGLPRRPASTNDERSRYIPQDVSESVLERDEGRCRAIVAGSRCKATTDLHFDHILPYARGGSSLEPKNIRILCGRHNLQKGSSQRL